MQPVAVVSLAKFNKKGREVAVKTWTKGILLVSDRILAHASAEILNCYKPDLLVLDEAHTMLTKPANVIYQRLKTIAPKRRIGECFYSLSGNVSKTACKLTNTCFSHRSVDWDPVSK